MDATREARDPFSNDLRDVAPRIALAYLPDDRLILVVVAHALTAAVRTVIATAGVVQIRKPGRHARSGKGSDVMPLILPDPFSPTPASEFSSA